MAMKYTKIFISTALILAGFMLKAQDAEQVETQLPEYVEQTFSSTRMYSSHTIETMYQGEMSFILGHRMGKLNQGAENLWGFYSASTRLGLDFGVKDWATVGVGIHTINKIFDGFAKFRLIRQCSGIKEFPVTITYYTSAEIRSNKLDIAESEVNFSRRLSFTHQLLIARKFNDNFSLQLMPTLVHRNLVKTSGDKNNVFSIGAMGRYKISRRVAVIAEYFYVFPDQIKLTESGREHQNPFALGIEIFTGRRHAFQICLANVQAMNDRNYLTENSEKFSKDGMNIGFNISTVFTLFQKND